MMHTFNLDKQGETILFRADPDPTASRCEFEVRIAPGADGPPPHYHVGQDETFAVVSGRLHVTVDGQEHRLRQGETVTIRSGAVHTFRNDMPNEPLVLHGAMEPALNFQWALGAMARSAIDAGGSWKDLPLLDAGWVLHQVRGEYYTAGIPRPLHHLMTALLAALATVRGRHKSIPPRPLP
jgi:mannose-6-phosphate isomerase-like protein (cupin superfamily)